MGIMKTCVNLAKHAMRLEKETTLTFSSLYPSKRIISRTSQVTTAVQPRIDSSVYSVLQADRISTREARFPKRVTTRKTRIG